LKQSLVRSGDGFQSDSRGLTGRKVSEWKQSCEVVMVTLVHLLRFALRPRHAPYRVPSMPYTTQTVSYIPCMHPFAITAPPDVPHRSSGKR